MDPILIPVLGILSSLIVTPGMIFFFIYKLKKNKSDVEKLKYQKEILELEIRKQEIKLQTLKQENQQLDRIIEQSATTGKTDDPVTR